MALVVMTWLWGSKYGADDVAKLAAGVRRHLKEEYRFLVFSDRPLDVDGVSDRPIYILDREALMKERGCFVRLRMFDPDWQPLHSIDDRLVCIDLDTVITGPLDPLFDRPEPFVILQGANASNPGKFNGSVMMLRAGAHPEVWSQFSLEAASRVPHFSFPDDQSWIENQLPDAAGWQCGPESGIWSFAKGKGAAAWPKDNKLPDGARIVAFPGHRDPSQFTHLPWIQKHWR